MNSPSRYTDPSGHAPCWKERLDDGPQCFRDINHGGLRFNNRSDLVWANWKYQGECLQGKHGCDEIAEAAEVVTSILVEPADWAFSANHCANGECSPWMLLGLLPFVPSSAGKYGEELIALVGRKGFATFEQLKAFLGSAGDNMVWHHIVEQSQILRSGFSPQQVHNTGNVIAVDGSVNTLINKIYSTNVFGPGSGTVRDWLTGQSFDAQYEYGLQVLRDLNIIP